MGSYLLISALNRVLEVLFLSHTHYRRTAAQPVARSLSRLILLVTLPWWKPTSALTGVALTYPLMEFVTFLLSLWMAWPLLRLMYTVSSRDVSLVRLLQQQGIYVIPMIPIKRVLGELPVWLLKGLAGDVAVGLYGAAKKGFALVYAFFAPLETILFPLVPEQVVQEPERIRVALRQAQKYTFWLSLVLIAFFLPMSPWFVSLIAGQAYMQATPVLQWLLGYLILWAFTQSHRPIFYALGEQRWLLLIYMLSLLTYAPLLWLGIQWSSAVGAAQSLILHGTLFIVVRLWVLRRLAPRLWVSPLTVFQIEEFDKRLFQQIRYRLKQMFPVH
jgi:O-antigen/teichoic acid export membrane protein